MISTYSLLLSLLLMGEPSLPTSHSSCSIAHQSRLLYKNIIVLVVNLYIVTYNLYIGTMVIILVSQVRMPSLRQLKLCVRKQPCKLRSCHACMRLKKQNTIHIDAVQLELCHCIPIVPLLDTTFHEHISTMPCDSQNANTSKPRTDKQHLYWIKTDASSLTDSLLFYHSLQAIFALVMMQAV